MGSEVVAVQQALVKMKFRLTTDGKFGGKTDWAIRAFQRRTGLLPDGVVGPKTLIALGIAPQAKPAPTRQAAQSLPQSQQNWLAELIGRLGAFLHEPASAAQRQLPLPATSSSPASQETSKNGQRFIYQHEAQKGVSNHLHWPGGASGVTLGPGYDMKERSGEVIARDLVAIGFRTDLASKVAKGAELKGESAKAFAEDNKSLIVLTEQEEILLLKKILPSYEQIVRRKIRVDLLPHEFDALVSFAYNPGGRFQRVADFINKGQVSEAMTEIKRAVTSKGHVMKGLVRRREHEVSCYLYGKY